MDTKRNKIKVLHFGYGGKLGKGVLRQLKAEQRCSESIANVEWTIRFFSYLESKKEFVLKPGKRYKSPPTGRFIRYLVLRYCAFRWLIAHAKEFDAVMVRYPLGDLFLIFACRKLRFFTVHHTRELEEIRQNTHWSAYFQYIFEKLSGKLVLPRAEGLVCLTREIARYEKARCGEYQKPCFIYPNGIVSGDVASPKDDRGGVVKLVMVCSKIYPWHGFDFILEQFQWNPDVCIELHVVGDCERILDDQRVWYHGAKDSAGLRSLYQKMDLGLGSFALFRNHMREACILKTREYLANGLPVYADYMDTAFPDDFQFFCVEQFRLETAISLAKHFRGYSKSQIQRASLRYIDKLFYMKGLVKWLEDPDSFNRS